MITGENLRQLRMLKGIKQEVIAKQLGISQPAYCKLERASTLSERRLELVLEVMHYTFAEASEIIRLLEAGKNTLAINDNIFEVKANPHTHP
jgi:transcriptional regulator with XRE-family HTH domain